MKNIIKTIISLLLAVPTLVFANTTTTWQATSTSANTIFPTTLNGFNPSVTAGFFIATTSTSTFQGVVSPCFATSTVSGCITGNGGGGTNYFSNSGASTTLTTGSNLLAGLGTFGTVIATSTTGTSTFANAATFGGSVGIGGTFQATGNGTFSNTLQANGGFRYANSNPLTDASSILYYSSGNELADSSGNLFYANGQRFSDNLGNLYWPNGYQMFDTSSHFDYPFNGDVMADGSNHFYLQNGVYDGASSQGIYGQVLTSQGTDSIPLWTTISGGSGNSAWTIANGFIYNATTSNMVGIGSTTPIATLSVQGSTTNPTRDLFDVASSSNANIFSIKANGNVGVGYPTPTTLLEVGGTLRVNGQTTMATASSTGLTVSATSTLSGIRLTNLTNTVLAVDTLGNVIATTTSGGGTNFFTNVSANTSLTTGSNLLAGIGTFGNIIATSTTATSTIAGPTIIGSTTAASSLSVTATGNVGISTSTPDSNLDIYGNVRFEGVSSVLTPSIGGAIVGIGCDSATTSVDATLSSTTTSFPTQGQIFPGAGITVSSYLTSPGIITTYVCSGVTVTPTSTQYIVKIIK